MKCQILEKLSAAANKIFTCITDFGVRNHHLKAKPFKSHCDILPAVVTRGHRRPQHEKNGLFFLGKGEIDGHHARPGHPAKNKIKAHTDVFPTRGCMATLRQTWQTYQATLTMAESFDSTTRPKKTHRHCETHLASHSVISSFYNGGSLTHPQQVLTASV